MDTLRRALENGQVETYRQDTPVVTRASDNIFSRWLVRLLGRTDENKVQLAYTRESVACQLERDYGRDISHQVLTRAGNKPLTARRIVQLHSRASQLRQEIEHSNSQHLKKWVNLDKPDCLACQMFNRRHGYPVSQLPKFERQWLQQHLEQSLHDISDHKLSRTETRDHIIHLLGRHQSAISKVTAQTASVIGHTQALKSHEPFYPQHFADWLSQSDLNEFDRRFAHDFMLSSCTTARLQWNSPYDQLDRISWEQQIGDAQFHRDQIVHAIKTLNISCISIPDQIKEAMLLDLHHQTEVIDHHIQFLTHLQEADFRSQHEQRKLEYKKLNTALLILDTEIEKKGRRNIDRPSARLGRQIEELERLRHSLLVRRDSVESREFPRLDDMKSALKNDVKKLQKELISAGIRSYGMKKQWRKMAAAVSNSVPWETISKTLPMKRGNSSYLVTSEQIPACQMRLHALESEPGNRDLFPVSYLGRGRSSEDPSESVHAINMYGTRLVNSENKVLYTGLRSGTLYPHGVRESSAREQGLESRCRELLSAAVAQKFATLSAQEQQKILDGDVLSMDFVTTSMLSPDAIRHSSGINSDEYTFQQQQNRILQQFCSERPLVLNLVDSQGQPRQLCANIRLASLNIPVDILAMNSAVSAVGRTWQHSDAYNDIGLEVLMGSSHLDGDLGGMVADWLQGEGGADASDQDVNLVLELVRQIRMLYSLRLHHSQGRDIFKLIERVQLLSFKIGASCHFGCKSGKDRTGEADARIKVFAAEVEQLGYIPDPVGPVSRDHREALQTFLYGGGGQEILHQNVNCPGYISLYGEAEQGRVLFKLVH